MIYLFDKDLKLIEIISSEDKDNPILENTQEWVLNGLITATARIIYKKGLDDVFYFGQKDDNKNFFIYKVRNTKKENKTITLNGIHIFFDELKGKIIRDIRPNDKTTSQAFTQILENTGWTPIVESAHSASANYYMQSTLSAFTDAIDVWEVEFIPKITMQGSKILKREVIIKDNISKDYGKWFEYGDKLISVVSELNLENIYTAYLGRGKGVELIDEQGNATGGFSRKIDFSTVEWKKSKGNPLDKPIGYDILEFPELNSLYSYPDGSYRIGIAEFDDIQFPSELLQATYDYAIENSRPKVQLKANAFLRDEIVEIGETVAIVRDDLNIRYKTKVFKIINDFNNGKIQTFEFGDKLVISQAQKTITAKKDQDKKFQEIESKLSQALDQITNYYFNEDGYNYELKVGNEYNLPAGYYSFDRPIDQNPTKVVYMGAGKVLISNKKGTDGAWIWQTAVTGDGIAGSALTTNSITANKLAADVGQSLDLSSNESITLKVKSSVQNYIDNNNDLLKGEDGKTPYLHIAYANSPDGKVGFSTTDSLDKLYIGQYTDYEAQDSRDPSRYKWSKIKGDKGADGIAGKDGVGIAKTTVTYGLSTNDYTEPTSWTSNVPSLVKGQFLWTKTVWRYSDGSEETGYIKTYISKDGNTGADGIPGKDGTGIKNTVIQYAKSTSGTTPPSYGWQSQVPSVPDGQFLWTKTTWYYTDNTNETGYSVSKMGVDGKDGVADYTEFRKEYESELNVLQGKIDSKVALNLYNENNKLVNEKFTQIEQTTDEIINTVSDNTFEALEDLKAEITEKLGNKLSQEEIQELIDNLENQIDAVSSNVIQTAENYTIEFENLKAEVSENGVEIKEITSIIQSGTDENGNPYTEWFSKRSDNDESNSGGRVKVGADGIEIISADQETMTFKDGEAYAKALYVTETIGFGNHTAQKYGTEYTIFSWNGG